MFKFYCLQHLFMSNSIFTQPATVQWFLNWVFPAKLTRYFCCSISSNLGDQLSCAIHCVISCVSYTGFSTDMTSMTLVGPSSVSSSNYSTSIGVSSFSCSFSSANFPTSGSVSSTSMRICSIDCSTSIRVKPIDCSTSNRVRRTFVTVLTCSTSTSAWNFQTKTAPCSAWMLTP